MLAQLPRNNGKQTDMIAASCSRIPGHAPQGARTMRFIQFMIVSVCLSSMAPFANAETTGQQKLQASKSAFRVCADPDNLPFTNGRGDGFENKIAEVLARSANQPLAYYWSPQRRGFITNTLSAWECDVVIGVPTHYELTKDTRPYYCSGYVAVHRPDQNVTPFLLDEARAQSLRIGVVEHTPPLDMLLRRHLDPIVYFTNYDQVNNHPGKIVADVAAERIDIALVWGPVGAYFAARQAEPLRTVALQDSADPPTRLAFPVSVGVRRGDKERSARIEGLLRKETVAIQTILNEYRVPLLSDPMQCDPAYQHAASEPAAMVQYVTEAGSTPNPDSGSARRLAQQTGAPQNAAESIDCNGPETTPDIEKLAGASPTATTPYNVQDGKVNPETYTGWIRYAAFCQACHGVGAVGSAIAPDLTQALKSLNQRQFETIVSCGLKGNLGTGVMPAWGNNPNIRPYIGNLWAYLRARAEGALGPGRPQKLSAYQ
jgi:mxaJ protein